MKRTSSLQTRVYGIRLLTTMSSQVVTVSEDGASITLLGNLFQCLSILTGRKQINRKNPIFKWNFLYFTLCLLLFILILDTTEKILALSSVLGLSPPPTSPGQILVHVGKDHPEPSSGWTMSAASCMTDTPSQCNHPCGFLLDFLQCVHVSLVGLRIGEEEQALCIWKEKKTPFRRKGRGCPPK